MMHLTADTSTILFQPPPGRRAGVSSSGFVGIKQRNRFPASSSDICVRPCTVVFFGYMPNFLEKHGAEFHYSVIGRFATVFLASGYVGGPLLNDDDAASNSQVRVRATCAELAASIAHKTVISDVSTKSDRLRFRTGERKINPND